MLFNMKPDKNQYEDLISDMARGNRRQPQKRGRKTRYDFVKHISIQFTKDKWEFITSYMAAHNIRIIRDVIYDAIEELEKKEKI